MTEPAAGRRLLPGAAIDVIDVVGPQATSAHIGALQDLHRQFFPEYRHISDEIAGDATGPGPYPGVVVHQWLLLVADRPVGFYIFHTNTARGVVLRHFLAVAEPARQLLPPHWLGPVSERIIRIGQVDCAAAGTQLVASASEIHPGLFHMWQRLGSRQLTELPYGEPEHGMHWRRYGPEPVFWDITPNVKLAPAGTDQPYPQVVDAVLRAFLLDHYRLPQGHPRVAAILAASASLRG